jgi:K+-transporting ATPase A subunit
LGSVTAGMLRPDTPLFTGSTIVTILVVATLSYLSALALGPVTAQLGLRWSSGVRRSRARPRPD